MFATANGMPMIVRASRKAVTTWARASSQPSRMSQMMFPMNERTPAVGLGDGSPAEGPHHEPCDPERRDAERDGDYQNACQDAGQDVGEPKPESGQHEPDDVSEDPHRVIVARRTEK